MGYENDQDYIVESAREIESLRAEVEKAERERDEANALAYVPNIWICDICDLVLDQKHFDLGTGEVGVARIQEVPICLNGASHGGMRRQSWRDNATGHADGCDTLGDEVVRFESRIAELEKVVEKLERFVEKADLMRASYVRCLRQIGHSITPDALLGYDEAHAATREKGDS